MASPLIVAALAAAAPLLAMASERWPGLAPCALCLWQRWPYWVAAGLAALAALVPGAWRTRLLVLAGVAVLVSGGIAVLHVGVEQQWWPSPLPGCQAPTAGGAASVDDLLRSLAPAPTKPCDAPTYLIPGLPVSIPMLNLTFALVLAGMIFRQVIRPR